MAFEVISVAPNSPADRAGIESGMRLLSIGEHKIKDVLDYKFHMDFRRAVLVFLDSNGKERRYRVTKRAHQDIGLVFSTYLMDAPRRCHNNCIFCFIDQLPKGMRDTLYFKDDDTRLSFLTGNYVTFTNVSGDEISRIIEQRISPINISVHTTNPELRVKMLNNKNASNLIPYMRRLYEGRIPMNAQIVLCPGVNDKEELYRSLLELSEFYPCLKSVSVVPVGLTKYRDGLFKMEPLDKELAIATLDMVEAFAADCKVRFGTNFVFCGDEFYLKAGREMRNSEYYEEFLQIENGVGMLSCFRDEFYRALLEFDENGGRTLKSGVISLITGAAAHDFISKLVDEIEKRCHNLKINIYKIENDFLGRNITVSGLLCGGDIIAQLEGKELGQAVLFPANMQKNGTDILLDDVTIAELASHFLVPFYPVLQDGGAFFDAFFEDAH